MILVICTKDATTQTDIVSHGIDVDTNAIISLPNVKPWLIGAKLDPSLFEYVFEDGCEPVLEHTK